MTAADDRPPFAARLDVLAWGYKSSPDLVFGADAGGRVVFVNDAARVRWPQAAPGVSAEDLFPNDARERFKAAEAAVLQTRAAGRFEWGDDGPGGDSAWFVCALSPLLDGDAVVGYSCVSSDVSELKRSEARLRGSEQLMVDTQGVAHLGTWEWDISQPTATWSSELYRIYGLTPDTYTPSYEKYLEMVHPDDRQRVIDATNRVFHEHIPYSHDERIFRPDGSLRYLHTWAHPVLDGGGRLVRLLGVCQDVTDRRLAEEEVRKLNAELEDRVAERTRTIANSLRDLEAFNAIASHDLRAPLSVIHTSCALILKRPEEVPARLTANIERIQRSTALMTSLVNDLLKLSQVGQAPLTRTEVDLSEISQEVVGNLRRSSPDRRVDVRIEAGLKCFSDAGLMRAAVENLLGNAWKYSARVDPARIEVGAIDASGRRTFYVRDNGAGFDMKDAHRLFAPFERLHKASEFEGTGVGLAAVHRIIERHNGRIWAESQPGRGATFFFELPR